MPRTLLPLLLAGALASGTLPAAGARAQAPSEADASEAAAETEVSEAVARLAPLGGSGVSGEVVVQRTAAGTRVLARIDGLAPGDYGFHLLAVTACDATVGAPTYDPAGRPHGGPLFPPEARRVGDLGNVRIRHRDPVGRYDRILADLPFGEALGRVFVVRAGFDDLHTQPLGGAGAAVACGVARPESE